MSASPSPAVSSPSPQIVHESETQRQYVRLQMPAKAAIQGETYTVRDLSAAGMGVKDVSKHFNKGQTFPFNLMLPFSGFTLDIALEAQVQYYEAADQRLGARFVNLTEDKVSILTRIVKAFIAGEVLDEGDILRVAGRDNFVKVRKAKTSGPANTVSIIQQILPLALIGLIGLAALYFIGTNVYQNAFVVRTSQGVVENTTVQINAPVDATYVSLLNARSPAVKKGDVLAQFGGTDGVAATTIVSPCDCYINKADIKDTQVLKAGTPLYTLTPMASNPWVVVLIPSSEALRLKLNGKAQLTFAGSDLVAPGTISAIEAVDALGKPGAGDAGLMARLKITPDIKIPPDLYGRPAQVQINL